ncbi:hypothetical protein RchiOBHm_Chr4g0440481 [Rosa chinensis]|uniref:Uncharacterized protein n=1 Tax=Rosa chinensis TaxID=74649 RepID=A0A2P6R335_ROSCH|nr:hypothetical protein RchiOBHm_Chr4g0440481 [Rosa chinensis]
MICSQESHWAYMVHVHLRRGKWRPTQTLQQRPQGRWQPQPPGIACQQQQDVHLPAHPYSSDTRR